MSALGSRDAFLIPSTIISLVYGFLHTVRGVLFTTLYFHEFHENCVIRENLIRKLQYLW